VPNFYSKHKSALDKLIFVAAAFAFVYVFITYLFALVAPFLLGFLLSLVLEPLIRLMVKHMKLGRGTASALCLLLTVAAVGFAGATIFRKLVSEAKSFSYSIPIYITDIEKIIDEAKSNLAYASEIIPEPVREFFVESGRNLLPTLTSSLGTGVKNGSWSVVSNIPGFLMNFLLTLISAFFFMKDRELIFRRLISHTPLWLKDKMSVVKRGMIYALWGYLKAEIILVSIIACIVIIGLLIAQYPFALFVGLLIAFVDAVPILGSGLILWPWAAFCFFSGNFTRGIILLLIYGTVLITRQTLEPRILGSQIGVHPLLVLSSMYIGVKLFGVLGFIIGPVIVVSVKAIYETQTKGKHSSA
jgi:sporulation integral membrane protein YtvI